MLHIAPEPVVAQLQIEAAPPIKPELRIVAEPAIAPEPDIGAEDAIAAEPEIGAGPGIAPELLIETEAETAAEQPIGVEAVTAAEQLVGPEAEIASGPKAVPVETPAGPAALPEPGLPKFRQRFRYMQAELKDIHRRRARERRRRTLRHFIRSRPHVAGALAFVAAVVLVILLFKL